MCRKKQRLSGTGELREGEIVSKRKETETRDKLPPWHYVTRTLCRLKCFMQVEISIKWCSNFLFKSASWLNSQIIHRPHVKNEPNANTSFASELGRPANVRSVSTSERTKQKRKKKWTKI